MWARIEKRREEYYVDKRVLVMEVQGKRRRGRPKWMWLDNIITICARENCKRRKRKTVLNGGASYEP